MVIMFQNLAIWATVLLVVVFFSILFGTVYIALKDLWKTYVDNKKRKGGKHGRK